MLRLIWIYAVHKSQLVLYPTIWLIWEYHKTCVDYLKTWAAPTEFGSDWQSALTLCWLPRWCSGRPSAGRKFDPRLVIPQTLKFVLWLPCLALRIVGLVLRLTRWCQDKRTSSTGKLHRKRRDINNRPIDIMLWHIAIKRLMYHLQFSYRNVYIQLVCGRWRLWWAFADFCYRD